MLGRETVEKSRAAGISGAAAPGLTLVLIGCCLRAASGHAALSTTKDVRAGVLASGVDIDGLTASTPRELDTAFAAWVQKRPDGIVVAPEVASGSCGVLCRFRQS